MRHFFAVVGITAVIILIITALMFLMTALTPAWPAQSMASFDCNMIREQVKQHGAEQSKQWAQAQGFSTAQINFIKVACSLGKSKNEQRQQK